MEKREKLTPRNTQAEYNRKHAKKRPSIAPRLDRDVMDELKAEAERRGISATKLAEIFIVEALRRQ